MMYKYRKAKVMHIYEKLVYLQFARDISVVKCFHEYPISSFYVKLLTNRQTNTG